MQSRKNYTKHYQTGYLSATVEAGKDMKRLFIVMLFIRESVHFQSPGQKIAPYIPFLSNQLQSYFPTYDLTPNMVTEAYSYWWRNNK